MEEQTSKNDLYRAQKNILKYHVTLLVGYDYYHTTRHDLNETGEERYQENKLRRKQGTV